MGRSCSSKSAPSSVARMRRRIASEDRNSERTTSAPAARQTCRNGASETPAMGARSSANSCADGYGKRMRCKILGDRRESPARGRFRGYGRPALPDYLGAPCDFATSSATTPCDSISPERRRTTSCEEMAQLLHADDRATATLLRILRRREHLGSTGVGRGIAIPHCRTLVVEPPARRVRAASRRRRVGCHRPAAGALPLPDRRAPARGVQPVPAGARSHRPVREGHRTFPNVSPPSVPRRTSLRCSTSRGV